jgi:hypothetical protein
MRHAATAIAQRYEHPVENGGGILITALVAGYSATTMQAQINPPVQQWHWTNNYQNHVAPYNGGNWIYDLRGMSDGGTVGVGYIYDGTYGTFRTSAVKTDANGNEVWNKLYTDIPAGYTAYGTLFGCAEVSDGYILVGTKGLTDGSYTVVVIKVDKISGAPLAGWPKYFDRTNLPGWTDATTSPRGKSVEVIYTSNVATGLAICGENLLTASPPGCIENAEFCRQRGAFVMKLTLAGVLDVTFNTTGWKVFQRAAGGAPDVQKTGVHDLSLIWQGGVANSTAIGILCSGMTINGSLADRDGFLLRCDLSGNMVYGRAYSEHQTTGCDFWINNAIYSGGYVDSGTPEAPLCTFGGASTENDFERLSAAQPLPNGTEAIITMSCDVFVRFGGRSGCVNSVIPSTRSYFDNDIALFRIDLATGAPMTSAPAPKNAARFYGVDYFVRSILTDNGANVVLMGNNENFPSDLKNDLVKVRVSDFAQQWRRQCMPPGLDLNCTFGLTTSIDGGLVVGGNNELNSGDYFMLKVGNDCGSNTGTLTYNGGFTAPAGTTNWTSSNKTIRGVLRVPSGAILNINGTSVVSFADTRAYNDYDFLAGNEINFNPFTSTAPFNSQPTKIIIEPGGKLVLSGTAKLTALTSTCTGYSGMWEGIEVWGRPFAAQNTVNTSNPDQGQFIQQSGTTVEKMYAGISAFRNRYNYTNGLTEHISNDPSFGGGGIVHITSATLANNRNGVYMGPYQVGTFNQSKFNGAVFIQNAQLADITFRDNQGNRTGTEFFLQSVQCQKTEVLNCRFKGFLNTGLLRQYRGVGIKANDAEVDCYTTLATPTFNFEDLAVAASGAHVVRRMQVRSCRMNNCDLGVSQSGGSDGVFTGNTINVPIGIDQNNYTCGIRVNGNSNVLVASNTITGMGTGGNTDVNRGVYIQDAGFAASLTGFNTFSKLRIGLQTAGVNGVSGTSTQGHSLLCNTMLASNFYDWAVQVQGTGVAAQQGQGCAGSQTQSGNLFMDQSACSSPTYKNILSGKSTVNGGTTPPWTYVGTNNPNENPNCVSINVTENNCASANSANCSSTNLICTTPACNTANVTAMNAETDSQKKELLQNRIIDYYYRVNDVSSAITSLVAWNTPSSKRRLVGAYLRLRQWANAQTALLAVGSANAEDAAFTSVYQTVIDIGNAGGTYQSLSTGQKTTMGSVANGTTAMRHTAQALLNAADGTPIVLVWEDPVNANGTSVVKSLEEAVFGDLVAMPNPFNDLTTLRGKAPADVQELRLVVADLRGRVMQDRRIAATESTFSTEVYGDGMDNGVYVCTVLADGRTLGVVRIVVQH